MAKPIRRLKHAPADFPKLSRRLKSARVEGSGDTAPYVLIIAALLLVVVLYNLFTATASGIMVNRMLAEADELARPAKIMITAITVPGCGDCYDISVLINKIRAMDINITSERALDYQTEDAKALIRKYDVKRLPSLILSGEVNKSRAFQAWFTAYGEQSGDALVVTGQTPPYYSTDEERVVGRVSIATLNDSACRYCSSLEPVIKSLGDAGIVIVMKNSFDVSSEEGKAIIRKYGLTKVPSLVVSREAGYYPGFNESWYKIGTFVEDSFVLRYQNPPYMNLETQEERGIVKMTLIDDSSCVSCYDPRIHKNILSRFGVNPVYQEIVDISSTEGMEFLKTYNITAVPTVILSKEVGEYQTLAGIWAQVGTVENDGAYVFRVLDAIGKPVYKNLATGSIVNQKE